MYLHTNNLYGWPMQQLLQVGGNSWVYINLDDVLETLDDAHEGFMLEIDPKHLHDANNVYPLAPQALSIHIEWLTDYSYQRALLNQLGVQFTQCTKLIPSIRPQDRYFVH